MKAKRVYLWTLPGPTIKLPDAARETEWEGGNRSRNPICSGSSFGVLPAVGHKNLLNLATPSIYGYFKSAYTLPPHQSPPHLLLFLCLRLDLDRITQRISTSLVVAASLRCNDMFHAFIFIVAWATNKTRGINKLICLIIWHFATPHSHNLGEYFVYWIWFCGHFECTMWKRL